jgi:hypothetical protein
VNQRDPDEGRQAAVAKADEEVSAAKKRLEEAHEARSDAAMRLQEAGEAHHRAHTEGSASDREATGENFTQGWADYYASNREVTAAEFELKEAEASRAELNTVQASEAGLSGPAAATSANQPSTVDAAPPLPVAAQGPASGTSQPAQSAATPPAAKEGPAPETTPADTAAGADTSADTTT